MEQTMITTINLRIVKHGLDLKTWICKPMSYKSMFYRSVFYKCMFYKSSPVQSIFYNMPDEHAVLFTKAALLLSDIPFLALLNTVMGYVAVT